MQNKMYSLIYSSTYDIISISHFVALGAALITIYGEYDNYKRYVKFSKYYKPYKYGLVLNFFLETLINSIGMTLLFFPYTVMQNSFLSEVSVGLSQKLLILILSLAIFVIISSIGSIISRKDFINLSIDPIAKKWVLLNDNDQNKISTKRRSDYLREIKRSVFTRERSHPS